MTTLTKTKLPKDIFISFDDIRPILKNCVKCFREDNAEQHTDEEWDTLAEILDEEFYFFSHDWIHDGSWHMFPRSLNKRVDSYVRMPAVLYQALWNKIGLPKHADWDAHEKRFAETSYLYYFEYSEDFEGWNVTLSRPFETWEDFQDANKDNCLIKENIKMHVDWDRDLKKGWNQGDKRTYGMLHDLYGLIVSKVISLEKNSEGEKVIVFK